VSAARTIPSPGRRLASAILIVFLLSLAVHAVALLQYRSDPFFETHVADALSYHEWARRIVLNGLAAEPVFHQSPLFPVLLAAIYGATAEEHWPVAALLLQMLLGSAAIALLVPLGRSLFGSTAAGLCAAGLVLLHGPFVFYGLKLLPVPLALATQCAALLALTVARNRGGAGLGILAGLHMALACLARSEMLLFLPFAVLALLFPAEPSGDRRRRLQVLPYLVAFDALVAPVTLHNVRQGDLVILDSSGGENLYIGNQSKGSGGYTALHPQAGDLFSQRALAEKIAEEERGEELTPSEISSYWRDRALRGIRDDPGGWLRLESRKLGRLLHPGDPTDIYSFALERKLYLTSLYALPLTPWLLLLLGVVGRSSRFARMRGRSGRSER
jgi:4-amino-4-deoxy-L-arabinose transferase-like glycosyltransferase